MVMERTKLEQFIVKYNLGGSCESVTWKSDGDTLSVRSMSDDKNVLSEIVAEKMGFPTGEFCVYETKRLRSMLNVLGETITVTPNMSGDKVTGLTVIDGSTKATVALADAAVIPAVPELKKIPTIDVTIQLDEKFINTFIRAKGALNEAETFTVMSDGTDTTASVVLGHSVNNNNRIAVTATTTAKTKLAAISFSANYLREILNANKDAKSGTLEISSKGISVARFTVGGFSSTYYLVQITT
jgi:hypothetical protein